jgi:hypothetical protein
MEASVPTYMRDLAGQMALSARALGLATTRQRTPDVLHVLALITTRGRADFPALVAEMRAVVDTNDAAAAPPLRVGPLVRTARAATALATTQDELDVAADLFRAVRILRRLAPGSPVPVYTDRFDAQTNLAVGRIDYVAEILPDVDVDGDLQWMIETELANPETGQRCSTYDRWLDHFNRAFEAHRMAPIRLDTGVGPAFDRITTGPQPRSDGVDDPLVTIVMSVFKPDQSLYTALRSLAAQTWTNLEVLVVDDCSPEEYWPLIDDAVAMDDRFVLHRMPVNGGTYAIRNFAIERGRGVYLGFQDSDDWSHPERIERQVRPMLAEAELVATLSHCLSVDGRLSLNHVGRHPRRMNSSSLLFRRDPVVAALGRFDTVRKGADSEFIYRLQAVFGDDRVRTLEEPLAIVQLTTGSLSRGEFADGWHDGNRVAYREAFKNWHASIAAGRSSARLGPTSLRPFPAPPAFLGHKGERRCDVLVVSDWRAGYSRAEGAAEEISALARAGLSCVMIKSEPMRFASARRELPSEPIMELRAKNVAAVGRWEDSISADVVLIRDPEALSYPPRTGSVGLRASRVVINAPFPPRAESDGSVVYDPAVVEANAQALFKGDVEWQPASVDVAVGLAANGARSSIGDPQVLGVVPSVPRRHGRRAKGRLIIGTAGLESRRGDRPTWDGLRARLPDDDRYDVRVHDPERLVDAVRGARPLPPNWLVTAKGSRRRFLSQLDVFVGYPTRSWGPAAAYSALEALALGCVLALDPSYEPLFHDAAVYLDAPAESGFEALSRDRTLFVEQQQRGYAFIDRNLSAEAFVARVSSSFLHLHQKDSA